MRKYFYSIILLTLLLLPKDVLASTLTGTITSNDVLIASAANKTVDGCNYKENGAYSSVYASPTGLRCLDTGETVTILDNNIIASTIDACKNGYYSVSFTTTSGKVYNGYVCSDYMKTTIDVDKYATELANAGFPESYFSKLSLLKELHPNWIFTAFKTGLDWKKSVDAESIVNTGKGGISLVQVTNLNSGAKYISLEPGSYDATNKTYNVKEGSNWYAANRDTVAYYLDPRNFLTEKEIFMFENLNYNSSYQTLEAVQNVLKNTDLYNYSNTYIEAATYKGNNINPVHLAASSKQEVVLATGKLSGSADGSGKIDGISYYNVYNIGAGSSCINPVECAIRYAAGGNSNSTSYERPWSSIESSIKGGSIFVGEGYLNNKQSTLYFKRWNVTSNIYGNYSNQYMTNVKGPVSEGVSAYNGYSAIDGLLSSAIEFVIPVYENMPATASMLPTGVDETKKEEIEQEEIKKEESNNNSESSPSIVNLVNGAGYTYNSSYISGVKISTTAKSLIESIKKSNDKVNIKITTTNDSGTHDISDDTKLGTGDIVSITSGDKSETFRVVIYGDVNGDGNISAVDYVKIKNFIMSSGNLSGSYKLAADVNKDNNISAVDYVNIKNYIMGSSSVLK